MQSFSSWSRYDEAGGYCLDAFYSGAGSILFTWDLDSSWQLYTTTITLPDDAVHMAFEFSLRCYGCEAGVNMSATWQIAELSAIELDTSLRNVIRTNVTDFEVMGTGPNASTRYKGWPGTFNHCCGFIIVDSSSIHLSKVAARCVEGIDYVVENPHAINGYSQAIDSRELNMTTLKPFVLRYPFKKSHLVINSIICVDLI